MKSANDVQVLPLIDKTTRTAAANDRPLDVKHLMQRPMKRQINQ